MKAARYATWMACTAALLCAACAASPEAESRRQAREADIADVLSMPLDPAEFGETRRCLSDMDFRNFRALDDRRILFEGRRGRLWLNTLRMPCPDLRRADVLVVKPLSGLRLCDMDSFVPADWFGWPWYRRWPWHWGGTWGTGIRCSLGKFQPVTADQVAEIESILRAP